ncbi:protein of unknown function [Paraburkholderia kururiensis]
MCGSNCIWRCFAGCVSTTRLTGNGRVLMPPVLPAPGGPGNRPQPDRPGQARLETAHRRRCARHSAGRHSHGRQPARFDGIRVHARCHSRGVGPEWSAAQTKGYDFARCRRYLKQRGITARIARRGVESKERLGRHRWVVERTHAWFAGFGKLRMRFERRLDIHVALLSFAAAVICSRFVDDLC